MTGAQVRTESLAPGPPVLELTGFSYNTATRRANLAWTSETGQTFRVESADDLGTWFPHITHLVSGGLSTTYLTPPAPAATTRRWWRVKRE